jgi:hypothetical protein
MDVPGLSSEVSHWRHTPCPDIDHHAPPGYPRTPPLTGSQGEMASPVHRHCQPNLTLRGSV